MFSTEYHLLGLELAANGFAGRQLALSALARDARRAGVPDVLTDILVSETDPEPARFRAFGRILSWLSRDTATGRPSAIDETVARAA